MKLFGRTNNKITKEKNDENVPHLEIIEVVLITRNIANNENQKNSRDFIHLSKIGYLVNY